jgi:nicotinate-nucleotide adenylyltransferase
MPSSKIGLLGGTFDPPHLGHLNLAIEALEKRELDEVWFLPTPLSPFKINTQLTLFHHRVKMLDLLIRGLQKLSINCIEEELTLPSYTYNTVKELKVRYPKAEFVLILADELLESLHQWKMPEALIKEVPLIIGARVPEKIKKKLKILPFKSQELAILEKSICATRMIEVSASEVRARLKKGLCCKHLVHQEVLDYIYKNQLYSSRLNKI